MSTNPVVAICLPMHSDPKWQWWRCFSNLHKPGGGKLSGVTHILDVNGYPVESSRRILTESALAVPEVTHLMWIDDDMTFPADALERLLSWDLPIVGGLCHARRPPYHPILGKEIDPAWGYGPNSYGFDYDYPKDTRYEVDVTGGAFLLIKREVFEAISKKFGERQWWEPDGNSEDFAFCKRAKACGYSIHVDTGLEIGHVAEVVINSETAGKLRPFRWQAWHPFPKKPAAGDPVASIVIPTYNQRPAYLKAAVMSALGQTVPVEVIVVDDGTDLYDVKAMLPDFPQVRYVKHERNCGIAHALNTGIAAMKTDWFCWLSSDDLLSPTKVATQLRELKEAGALCGFHGYGIIKGDGTEGFSMHAQLPSWKTIDEQMAVLGGGCAINGSTVMINLAVFDAVGDFDGRYRYSQDWEMWCRIGERHLWHKTEEILGTRREGGLTNEIAVDPEKKRLRDDEDAQIQLDYGRGQ